ncbi:MAG: M13 family metallopeptidase [Steroidobacteraceae bacterium]
MQRVSLTVLAVLAMLAGTGVVHASALHDEWLDKTADPLKDFFQYANGGFLRANPIPPAYSSWGQFQILNQSNQDYIHELLQAAAANKSAVAGSDEQKIGAFFASGMDAAAVEKAGSKPLAAELLRIAALRRPQQLTAALARLQSLGVNAVFGMGQMQDFDDSTRVVGVVSQGGIGLPDRDYYLKDDPKYAAIRQSYEEHIARMFTLLGDKPAAASAAAHEVMALETRLAKASMPVEEQRDPHAVFHMTDLAGLAKAAPAIDWPRFISAMGVPPMERLNLAMPAFFAAVSQELNTTPMAQWRNYLRWQLVHRYAPYLSKAYVDENFKLAQAISGSRELLPRWRRVLSTENGALGFAVGHEFVKHRLPPEARAQVLDILHGVRAALKEDLQTLAWMSDATRVKAIDKLTMIEERIGYPDRWRDYSKLHIDRGSYVANVMRANLFDNARELAKIGKPVDRSEWVYPPQVVNAYYDPSLNSINFLAGILQPPFFDANAPASFNYGAIGAVIGHEITHGFDDQGSQFDGHGNLANWWAKEDSDKFKVGVDCVADQFSAYTVDGDLHLKGHLVTGEAIADLGGLLLAYRAFHASPAFTNAPTLEGYTPDQQFFLSFARFWAQSLRPEQARAYAASDPHPPGQYRVNGTLANIPQFAQAFGAPAAATDPKRCVIW